MFAKSSEIDSPMNRQLTLALRQYAVDHVHTLERFAADNFR